MGEEPLLNRTNSSISGVDDSTRILIYNIVVPLLISLCLASFIVNAYIVLLYRWLSRPMTVILKLTIGLAGADCWSSIIIGAGFLINSYLPMKRIRLPKEDCVGLGLEALRLGGILTSILHLLLISLSHLLVIVSPHRGPRAMSGRVLQVLLFTIWFSPPVGFLAIFALVPNQGFRDPVCPQGFLRTVWFRVIIFLFLLIPVFIMAGFYVVMIVILHRADHQFAQKPRKSHANAKKWRTLRTTLLMLGTFLMGWLPSGTTFVLTANEISLLHALTFVERVTVSIIVNFLMILKFFVNPLVYSIRVPEIRGALWKPLRSCRPNARLRMGNYTSIIGSLRTTSLLDSSPISKRATQQSYVNHSSVTQNRRGRLRLSALLKFGKKPSSSTVYALDGCLAADDISEPMDETEIIHYV